MPFEPAPKTDAIIEARIALADLAHALRTAKEHRWSFLSEGTKDHCGTTGCAIGLARAVPSCCAIWPGQAFSANDFPEALTARGVPGRVVASFFYGGYFNFIKQCGYEEGVKYIGTKNAGSVTQAMVADRIEHWLATGEIK